MNDTNTETIYGFCQRIFGKNLWLISLIIACTAWFMFCFGNEFHDWPWYLPIAIASTLLTIILYCLSYGKFHLKSWKDKRDRTNLAKEKEEKARIILERKKQERHSLIWKYVAYTNIDNLNLIASILELDCHDNNKLTRYFIIPKNPFSKEYKYLERIIYISSLFTFSTGYINPLSLITVEKQREVVFFYIDSYFFDLLENYRKTHKWEKLK